MIRPMTTKLVTSTAAEKTTDPKAHSRAKIEAGAQRPMRARVRPQGARAANSPALTTAQAIKPEARQQMIEVAAYYCAERRHFEAGHELDDWLEAEAEIDRVFGKGRPQPEKE